jgi:hypothetical protein
VTLKESTLIKALPQSWLGFLRIMRLLAISPVIWPEAILPAG